MSSERKILKATRRKKEDYINSLPDEILRIVFDRLELGSVKNASATCQRWHSIIFLSGYVCRFVFKVELSSSFRNTSARQMQIMELKSKMIAPMRKILELKPSEQRQEARIVVPLTKRYE
ncbi:uncharacterized protein LOC126575115 [Anopheles aquasalis]|uniref:uncharacterized protein LOC126575115 n=1 Tax=Anopheles aquasalis TaxID=42839 RepID=UPI00215AEFFF|nr:uncharacterized protein LOC126575115 [Anopheles aquasalis]